MARCILHQLTLGLKRFEYFFLKIKTLENNTKSLTELTGTKLTTYEGSPQLFWSFCLNTFGSLLLIFCHYLLL